MPLTRDEHRREAEKLLSRASFERSESDPTPSLDPDTTALLIGRAQVHATLAGDDHDAVLLKTMRRIVGGHIAEGLDHDSRELRDFLRGLAYELKCAGVSVEDVVKRTAVKYEYFRHQYLVDDVFYSLDHQYVDALGVVWEHVGKTSPLHEPVMCTPDMNPGLPNKPLPELIWTRGPLRTVQPTPHRSYEEGWGSGPTFDPETGIYQAYGWPARNFDLNQPLEDNDGNVWRWTGDFEHGEPWIRREVGEDRTGSTTILSAVEVFNGPLHQLEVEDDDVATGGA
jgi:hypothetical protein